MNALKRKAPPYGTPKYDGAVYEPLEYLKLLVFPYYVVLLRYCPPPVIARSAVRHDVAIPLGNSELASSPDYALLRHAGKGIASSL
ncbi:MAG TPA: hypothetical protein PKY35_03735 [Candidatus Hydrogenedentes bacterium]|nr:hypothetical protein [Candidatus Hydrogenedentota bacterium]HOL76115.1 hypothetical protein [Candidatus Hydrogenedentota bacterium]